MTKDQRKHLRKMARGIRVTVLNDLHAMNATGEGWDACVCCVPEQSFPWSIFIIKNEEWRHRLCSVSLVDALSHWQKTKSVLAKEVELERD